MPTEVDILLVPKISDSTQLAGKSLTISDDTDGTPYRFSGDTINNAIQEIDDKVDQVDGYQLIATADVNRLADTSGENTGDQQASDFDIKDLTDSTDLRGTWSGKQDALGFTPENVINKKQTVANSETDYPSGKAVHDALALKENLLPATPENPELKFLNGLRQWATIALRHNQLSDPNGDENYQHVTKEAQTFDGVKTFEDSPIVPTPTLNTEVANKKYVDDADALKVNKADIANNLTTTTEGKVLDARQGKVLSDADAAIIADEKVIVPSIAFYKRVLADSGTIGDKTILAKLFTDKLKSLSTTQVLYMPHLGMKERTSGVNKFASKVYDAGLSNIDAVQATEATQPFIGGFIAPNSLKGLKYVQGQTQTGEVAFTEKSYLATDSWSLTIVLKANKRAARILLGANSYLEIGTSTITLHNGTAAILTATYSFDCGKTAIIGFHYSNRLGLIKVDNVPLTTTTTSGVIAFSKMAYSSANPFDGLIYYFHLQNERISEAESQQNYALLRALFPDIEGIAIGNQFWASSNYEGTVAGDGTVIPEVQPSVIGAEIVTNGGFDTDTDWVKGIDPTSGNNWTIASGTAIHTPVATTGLPVYLSQIKNIVRGKLYKFEFTVNALGTARFGLIATDSTQFLPYESYSTGTYIKYIYTTSSSTSFIISSSQVSGYFTLDNISFKEAGWSDLTYPAWCHYDNNPANGAVYGKLYNWYAVELLSKYPPKGWRVPSSADFTQLQTYLGGSSVAGGKISINRNESGLSILYSGLRVQTGLWGGLGAEAHIWTSTGGTTNTAYRLFLANSTASTEIAIADQKRGMALRLIRNSPVGDPRKQVESGFFTTDIASAAKSIAIPFGYVVKEIRITTTTSVTSIEAKLHNTAGTAVATLITGKACNATSTTFVVTADQPTQLTDPTVRVTAAGNNATSIGMNITVIIEKIEL